MMGIVEDFVVARIPDPDSALTYLIRLPLGPHGVVLKVTPGVLAEGLAEAQVRFPSVPIVFCETRRLA